MASPISGQISVSSNPVALSATPITVTAFTIKAPQTNEHAIYIGPSGVSLSSGYQLDPGDVFTYELITQNGVPTYQLGPADFYAVGTSGDTVSWLASP